MNAPVKVGVIGLGTVGQGVLRLLQNNAEEISRRVGRRLVVTQVATRTPDAPRECSLQGVTVSGDAVTLAREADIDVLVELIGGATVAREAILQSEIPSGKKKTDPLRQPKGRNEKTVGK